MSQPASGDVVVLDTVVLSLLAARSRRPEVVAHWPEEAIAMLDTSVLAISPVTVAEVEYGLLKNPGHELARSQRATLSTCPLLPIDPAVIAAWAHLRHGKTPGLSIGDNDLWIAATASAHGI
jgi:predicted nucleic acid-binding protein